MLAAAFPGFRKMSLSSSKMSVYKYPKLQRRNQNVFGLLPATHFFVGAPRAPSQGHKLLLMLLISAACLLITASVSAVISHECL